MIKEGWTLIVFGYTSDEWAPKSEKPIIVACDECEEIRASSKKAYRALCYSCAIKTPEVRHRRSEAQKNRPPITETTRAKHSDRMKGNNYRKGKCDTDETRCKKSESAKRKPPVTDETKHRMSIAQTGRIVSDEGRRNISKAQKNRPPTTSAARHNMSEAQRGEKNGNWKGGVSSAVDSIRSSMPYKQWRTSVYTRDGFMCCMCGDDSGGNLQAHHIRPVRDNKNNLLLFDVNNGITLCEDCHKLLAGDEYLYIDIFDSMLHNRGVI